jgi:hypothetical protein
LNYQVNSISGIEERYKKKRSHTKAWERDIILIHLIT